MIDTVEELQSAKTIFVLNTDIFFSKGINYAVYKVVKSERRGVNNWFFQLKTSARNKSFHKTMNIVVRYSVTLPGKKLAFDNLPDLIKEYCLLVKKDPEKNKELTKKLSTKYPHYFV